MDKHLLPSVIPDELLDYFRKIEAAISHKDPKAGLKYNQFDGKLKVYVFPSDPILRESLIENLLGVHIKMRIKIVFSKSLAISKSIYYEIDLNTNN